MQGFFFRESCGIALYVVSWGRVDKLAGFLERGMILEDYRGHGSGTLVFVFLYFVVEALISGPGWGFSHWGFPHL
jgi:hypothetical protein